MPKQPTILVKKADGTTVRLTLDELKQMQKVRRQGSKSTANGGQAKSANKVQDLKIKKPEIKNIPQPQIKKVSSVKKTEQAISSPVELKKSSEPEALLPFSPQAVVEEEEGKSKWEVDDHKSLLDDAFHEEELPVRVMAGEHDLSRTTPVKDVFVDKTKVRPKEASQEVKPLRPNNFEFQKPTTVQTPKPVRFESELKLPAKPAASIASQPMSKPVIHDVKPPKIVKQSMGPIDELGNFSLIDFRRLAANVEAAGAKLLDKFKTLEHDSYLLFMDGIKAWYNSPLYADFQDIISQSLKQGKSINELIASTDQSRSLKMEEFKALLQFNQSIS